MIKIGNGKIELVGTRQELQVEYMMLIDHIKKSDLFSNKKDFEMSTMFVLMNENDQRDCVVKMIDEMIKELEKAKKK